MRNIRLRLQYEGTRYQGWQKQTSTDNTIQGKMETLLTKMCGEPIEISASGRRGSGAGGEFPHGICHECRGDPGIL